MFVRKKDLKEEDLVTASKKKPVLCEKRETGSTLVPFKEEGFFRRRRETARR